MSDMVTVTEGDISKNFNRSEFACQCDCGVNTVDVELISVLQELREHFDEPIRINSGIRCQRHNARIGGSEKSQHLMGKAADVVVKRIPEVRVHAHLLSKYSGRYGIGLYDGWVHIDVRSNGPARWDNRGKG